MCYIIYIHTQTKTHTYPQTQKERERDSHKNIHTDTHREVRTKTNTHIPVTQTPVKTLYTHRVGSFSDGCTLKERALGGGRGAASLSAATNTTTSAQLTLL